MTQSTPDRSEPHTGVDDRAESERYRLFAAERRRLVLDVLAGQPDSVELTELASGIVARESGHDANDPVYVERVAVTLHHVHLPMLSQFGLLEYDADATRIESCPSRADVRAVTPTRD